jgi:hypothetical protein
VLGVAEHAELELGARDRGQGDRAVETLVLLGIILLEADLELDGLGELTGLGLGLLEDEGDAVADGVGGELAVESRKGGTGGERSVICL